MILVLQPWCIFCTVSALGYLVVTYISYDQIWNRHPCLSFARVSVIVKFLQLSYCRLYLTPHYFYLTEALWTSIRWVGRPSVLYAVWSVSVIRRLHKRWQHGFGTVLLLSHCVIIISFVDHMDVLLRVNFSEGHDLGLTALMHFLFCFSPTRLSSGYIHFIWPNLESASLFEFC